MIESHKRPHILRTKNTLLPPLYLNFETTYQLVHINLTLFVLGGAESTPWPEKCVFRPVVDEKSEIKGQKNPSPRPLTPPNTLGFFLYTRTTLKLLVEHQNRVFSCSVFICVNERTKCAKNPNINRVNGTRLEFRFRSTVGVKVISFRDSIPLNRLEINRKTYF